MARPPMKATTTTDADTLFERANHRLDALAERFDRHRPLLAPLALSAVIAWIAACENPQPPNLCGVIPQQTITVGESASVTACFDDPNGAALRFQVWTSDAGVVEAAGVGASVTITAMSPGNALVTILADNGFGLKAQQSFAVLVPNRTPLAVGEIANREVAVGDSVTVDVSSYFSEPDGQPLTYSAESDSSVTILSVADAMVTVVAVSKGTRTVTLTATDPGGLTAAQSFMVTVPNRAPLAEGSLSDQTIEVGDTASMSMSPYFVDLDGDALTYAVESSDATVIAAMVTEDMVSIMAVAKGAASVTVTATDDEGLTATQTFGAMVPNRPPLVMDSIPARTVAVGETAAVAMAPFFSDPDEDALTYTATVGDPAVAAASPVGGSVEVTAIAKGRTTVTVTATDTEGLAVAQDFAITVPNRGPVGVGEFSERTVQVDSVITVELAPHFTDPDGDALAYAAATSDSTVVTAAAVGTAVTVTGVARGQATVTVTATDTEGLVATQRFSVTVPNRAPMVASLINARRIPRKETETLDLTGAFSDPDGDSLTYEVVSSVRRLATGTVAGVELTLSAWWTGTTIFTVTASDPEGLTARQEFQVTVTRALRPNRPPVVTNPPLPPPVAIGESFTTNLNAHFADPDNDALTFSAVSSDPGVAVVKVSGRTLEVRMVSKGAARIKVTAVDTRGESTTVEFTIHTEGLPGRNLEPVIIARFSDVTLSPGGTLSINLGSHFEDPNDDPLTYGASSSDDAVAAVAIVSGSTLRITAAGLGTATVTATAADPLSLEASLSLEVAVETGGGGNRRPRVTQAIAFQTLEIGGTSTIDLAGHFSDPDGNPLTFAAESSSPGAATAEVSGSELTVTGVAAGTTTITVSARDSGGLSATHSFDVTVPGANQAPYVRQGVYDRTIVTGAVLHVFPSTHFWDDYDGSKLRYSVTSSNSSVVRIDAGALTQSYRLRAVASGTSTISLSATDSEGLKTEISFTLTVGNNAPRVTTQVSAMTLAVGELDTLDASSVFEDSDDGDRLRFTASSSNNAIASVRVWWDQQTGDVFEFEGKAVGEATATLAATDQGGLKTEWSVTVTVDDNEPPRVEDRFPSKIIDLPVGETLTYTLADYFEDEEDGDNLTYSASSNGSKATVEVSNGILRVIGVGFLAVETITVTAADTGGKTASQSFRVLAKPNTG